MTVADTGDGGSPELIDRYRCRVRHWGEGNFDGAGRCRFPEPVSTPVSAPHEHLSRSLRSINVDDPFVTYQDRADLAALTGNAPIGWAECEAALERFVLADEGAHDAELVMLFNRRWRRYKALMGPPGSAMAAHHTMQPLGRSLLP